MTISFPLVDDPSTSLLAWTTTPWTLPSNLALCVNPNYTYIKIEDQERKQNFILHENLLRTLYKDPKKAKFKKLGQFKGSEMMGWRYVPLFDYFVEKVGADINPLGRGAHYSSRSMRTRLLGFLSMAMSPMPMAQVLFTKRPPSVTMITVSCLHTVSYLQKKCLLVPLMMAGGLRARSPIFLGNMLK